MRSLTLTSATWKGFFRSHILTSFSWACVMLFSIIYLKKYFDTFHDPGLYYRRAICDLWESDSALWPSNGAIKTNQKHYWEIIWSHWKHTMLFVMYVSWMDLCAWCLEGGWRWWRHQCHWTWWRGELQCLCFYVVFGHLTLTAVF